MKETIIGICCCLGMMSNVVVGMDYDYATMYGINDEEEAQTSFPLFDATISGNLEDVKRLLADPNTNVNKTHIVKGYFWDYLGPSYCDPDAVYYKETMLLLALINGQTEIAKELLSHPEIDVNKGYNSDYNSPISAAVGTGNIEILRMLLARPEIDVNVGVGSRDYSPLCLAVFNGNTEAVKELLAHQNIDVNGGVLTFFDQAATNGWLQDWEEENSPLCLAARTGDVEIIKLLLERPEIDVNKGNFNQCGAPLYIAVAENKVEAVKLLIEHPNIILKCGRKITYCEDCMIRSYTETAYERAVRRDRKEIGQLFMNHMKKDGVENKEI